MNLNTISVHKKLLVRAAQIGVRSISCSSALKKEKNLYETLGLTRDATQADIKNAYFELSKLYHPDRIAATDENLAKFREVSTAYEILGNEQSRRMYDRGLLGGFKPPGIDEEPQDPIVKFYKKRQEVSQASTRQFSDVEAWAQTYYTEAKKKASKKQELYMESASIDRELDRMSQRWLEYLVYGLVAFLWLSNFKDTKAEKYMNKFYSLFG